MIRTFIRKHGKRKLVCLVFDLVSCATGAFCSFKLSGVSGSVLVVVQWCAIFSLATFLTILSFRYHNLYKKRVVFSNLNQLILLSRSAVFTFLSILVLQFFLRPQDTQSHYGMLVGSYLLISYCLILFNRFFVVRYVLKALYRSSFDMKNVIAVGAGHVGSGVAKQLRRNASLGYNLVGFVDDKKELFDQKIENVRVLGTTDELPHLVSALEVDEVFVTINHIDHQDLLNLIERCKNVRCPINVISDHFDILERKMDQWEFDELRFVRLLPGHRRIYQTVAKRMIDVIAAAAILIPASPFLALVGILIKLSSRGPIIYAPIAIGKDGRPFKFYKLRSMDHNSPDDSHRQLVEAFISGKKKDGRKLDNDPRIMPIGKFLRKHSIDEFAQLLNVLKGDMSLVGPRPSAPYEYDKMEAWHKRRYSVLPGMTGLWQVSGRSEVSFKEMVVMDLYYIENCSFWLDMVILLKTVKVVVFGRGGS